MSKQPPHRFTIWSLADNSAAVRGEPNSSNRGNRPPAVSDRSKHAHGLNPFHDERGQPTPGDLAILESLYDYGPSVTVVLPAKCITPNGRSIASKTKRISTDAVHFAYAGDSIGNPAQRCDDLALGTHMQFDIDQIGAVGGALAVKNRDGFEIAVDHDCKNRLNAMLTALTRARGISFDETSMPARERITRIEPDNKKCSYRDQAGTLRKGRLVNVSQVDALVTATMLPSVATHIVFTGPRPYLAEVLRTFEIGFAVRFCPQIPDEEFSPAINLSEG